MYFASSNENKFLEIQSLYETENKENVKILFSSPAIKEIQSDSITEVAEDKAKKAFSIIKSPVIVEDDGLFIEELNGFPGVYSSFVFKTIGNIGILNLLANNEKRNARFLSVFSFFDGNTIETFRGETAGHITMEIFPSGWGFDPIFKPENEDLTYGELNLQRKNDISHRSKAFRQFLRWYKLKYNHHNN
ncbi:MAG: RdgB/HAM1 family non-canonical purine NTP pyrophosphatase [Thermoproteota archaeon]|nr:RdgB/HAM1 family non-canonical purine NTP pyrophosphatase [Thermoproteota archaeon]